jgi:RHS repeat-associated protein
MLTHGGVTLAYDGDGNRVSETIGGTTTKFLVDDRNPTGLPQVLDEVVSGAVLRTYGYGSQRISENQQISGTWMPSFYGYDGHGNVRFLANSGGAITDSYDYDAFGMPIRTSGTTSNVFLYSGERYDSSVGLYDLRARYYNQATGRFWARDPGLDGKLHWEPTWNPYLYAMQNPINLVDPTGRDAEGEEAEILTFSLKEILPLTKEVTIEGTVEIQHGTAYVYVDLLQGVLRNPFQLNALLTKALVDLGASEMWIAATLANEQLESILVTRYAWVRVGGELVYYQKF